MTVNDASPFHKGEIAVQEKLGVRHVEDWARKVIRDYMPDQHRDFFTTQPFLVMAARDDHGHPQVTLIEGPQQDFVASPAPDKLAIKAQQHPGDALAASLIPGSQIGLLGIELATRRRNRVNGRIIACEDDHAIFQVGQSFGNCPQYISERHWVRVANHQFGDAVTSGHLNKDQEQWIAKADTFFIASGYQGRDGDDASGLDASHRGGAAGFVRVLAPDMLQFPDYAGNNHYNTLGNLVLDNRVGLVFVNFDNGDMLQISGRADIDWDSDDIAAIPGAQRLVNVRIENVNHLSSALSLRWRTAQQDRLALRLRRKIRESNDVQSFEFSSADSRPLPPFLPGQHLPVRLAVKGGVIDRSYSLSNAGEDGIYRISVKRESHGTASRFLHDTVLPGAVIDAGLPAGDFHLPDAQSRPLLLVGGGIGVTPLVSIFAALAKQGTDRPVSFVQAVRDGGHHAFRDEIRVYANATPGFQHLVWYSQPRDQDIRGRDFDHQGRVTAADIKNLADSLDVDVFLCGPGGFVADLQDGLEKLGVPASNIYAETF